MITSLLNDEIFGFVRPVNDAHTLGISNVVGALEECGYKTVIADAIVCKAITDLSDQSQRSIFFAWISSNRISRLGFSYRLDPEEGAEWFAEMFHSLQRFRMFSSIGGPVRSIYFAGLPETCRRVVLEHGKDVIVFSGDETPMESLNKLGVPSSRITNQMIEGSRYDEMRASFGAQVVSRGEYLDFPAPHRLCYREYGTDRDSLLKRLTFSSRRSSLPLTRAHMGLYEPNYLDAKKKFNLWVEELAKGGYLDVLSIGTSQLSQSHFGETWGDLPNGGGVPVNSVEDYVRIWNASRPMLVRTYAGTKRIEHLARIHERVLNIAWHAFSFWWFCKIDGRGCNSVLENLREYSKALRYVAETGKPLEPNVPHHFSFRGGDDITYIVSAYIGAKIAKLNGIHYLVLQAMLNTPKQVWGIQDLAKIRALLKLVRELEDGSFRVILQPRAGLEHFSSEPEKAKAQLAAATAIMDDIEPNDDRSPPIIHVVGYSEATNLATPEVIDESIKITFYSLQLYRQMRMRGLIRDLLNEAEINNRVEYLYQEARVILSAIESSIDSPYTPEGLYQVFWAGFLPVPYLWECRDEFCHAVEWKTSLVKGGVAVVNEKAQPVGAHARATVALNNLKMFPSLQ